MAKETKITEMDEREQEAINLEELDMQNQKEKLENVLEQNEEEKAVVRPRRRNILTIDSNEVQNQLSPEERAWHEIQSSARSRRILTGQLSGIERLEAGGSIVVVNYNDIRVVIPISEMMIELRTDSQFDYGEMDVRIFKIINNMLGCDIDFIVRGIDAKTHSAVASRKDAMLRKRQTFYLTPDHNGLPKVYEDGIVESRVIAVAEKVVRVEIFGVETSIPARELTWDWCGDARERFNVGDEIKVKVNRVEISEQKESEGQPNIQIEASVKQATKDTVAENLAKCKVQSTYAGTITNIANGTMYVRLNTGVNAIAYRCNDRRRLPAKNDSVSFVVTRVEQERRIAIGLITKIIKQRY